LCHVKSAKGVLMKARALNEGAAWPSRYVFPTPPGRLSPFYHRKYYFKLINLNYLPIT
jgi:hypothetical protein